MIKDFHFFAKVIVVEDFEAVTFYFLCVLYVSWLLFVLFNMVDIGDTRVFDW